MNCHVRSSGSTVCFQHACAVVFGFSKSSLVQRFLPSSSLAGVLLVVL